MKSSFSKMATGLPGIFLLAICATGVTFGLVKVLTIPTSYLYKLFFERSWIQYATTFAFWFTMCSLFMKHLAHAMESQARQVAKQLLQHEDLRSTLIWTDADMVRQKFEAEEWKRFLPSLTFSRILNGLDRLRKTQSTTDMDDYFHTRSDIDADEMESDYAGVRYCIWLIPSLGFLGTVMGIGIGIAGFSAIIQNAKEFTEVQKSLPMVTQQLGTAFDTTLLALGLSIIAMFYLAILRKRQEELLQRIDHLCIDDVCSLFQEHDAASENLIRTIEQSTERVLKGMHGDRAEVTRVIAEEFPSRMAQELDPMMQKIHQALLEVHNQLGQMAHALQAAGSGQEAQRNLANLLAGLQARLQSLDGLADSMESNRRTLEQLGRELESLRRAALDSAGSSKGVSQAVERLNQILDRYYSQQQQQTPPRREPAP